MEPSAFLTHRNVAIEATLQCVIVDTSYTYAPSAFRYLWLDLKYIRSVAESWLVLELQPDIGPLSNPQWQDFNITFVYSDAASAPQRLAGTFYLCDTKLDSTGTRHMYLDGPKRRYPE